MGMTDQQTEATWLRSKEQWQHNRKESQQQHSKLNPDSNSENSMESNNRAVVEPEAVSDDGALQHSGPIYRHGDRSPIENYPNGLHSESEWPQGFGQLTKIGMQQQYELGQYIKKRYSDFLSAGYNREEILIQSTEIDRTIMSAQANLAGMFPPIGDQIWNPELLWQPIPVHVITKASNPKLRYPIFQCPRYIELLKKTIASNEFQEKIRPYEEFIKTIAYYSGYNASVLKNPMNFKIWHVQDTLFCESIHNYTLPEWATEDVMRKLTELTELSLSSLFGIYKREEKARLQGGLLVKDILQKFSEARFPQKRKMIVYSAHDTTLGALQMALNIYNYKLPPYASCQIFEQYEEENGLHTIEMYFQNDTSKESYPVTLPGCSYACPLQQFAKLVFPILVDNWEKECEKIDIDKEKFPEPADDPLVPTEKVQDIKATTETIRL
ncbi:prostatic acid phosphatase-like [Thamnophis elegans]|uniref:prostatic acid phosphatase-like n=1 Tax=Thamnophis elegans TaxID=35005 RepID=UPI001378BD0D|nr:prostatic acid phosphatase-like [Thamnophis elegans]